MALPFGRKGGQERGRQLGRIQERAGPLALLEVQEQRARGEADVGGPLAAQAPGQIVADVQPRFRSGEQLGPLPPVPEQLEQAEGRVGAQAGDAMQGLEPDRGQEPFELARGARVVPGDDRRQGVATGIHEHAGLADAGDRDAPDRLGVRQLRHHPAQHRDDGVPQALGVQLCLIGAKRADGRRLRRCGDQRAVELEDQRADLAGAGIDAAQQGLAGAHETEIAASARCRFMAVPPRRRIGSPLRGEKRRPAQPAARSIRSMKAKAPSIWWSSRKSSRRWRTWRPIWARVAGSRTPSISRAGTGVAQRGQAASR